MKQPKKTAHLNCKAMLTIEGCVSQNNFPFTFDRLYIAVFDF